MSEMEPTLVIETLKKELRSTHVKYTKQQVAFFNALKKKFGDGVVDEVRKISTEDFCKSFLEKLPDTEKRTIETLIKILWEPLRKDGFQFTMETSAEGVQMKCTVCPLAQLYRALGAADWGYQLYCAGDEPFVEAFNNQIGFRRKKTLMQGDECCDHFYYVKS